MNWLKKHRKFAQNFPLSIEGLLQAKGQITTSPDIPNQNYLFQGPGVNETAFMRGSMGSVQRIDELIQMFNNVFDVYSELKDEYDWDQETDENQLQDTMHEYASMFVSDHDFTEEEIWSFFRFADEKQIEEALPPIKKLPTKLEFQQFYQMYKTRQQDLAQFGEQMEFSADDVAAAFEESLRQEQEGYDGLAIFEEAAERFTIEFLKKNADAVNDRSYAQSVNEDMPEWIDNKQFLRLLPQVDGIVEWYKEENDSYLRQQAEESQSESNAEYFNEHKRELNHQFGFDVIELFSTEYDPSFADERQSLTLSQLGEIGNELRTYMIMGGAGVAEKTNALLYAIRSIAKSDEKLNFIFAYDLNNSRINAQSITEGAKLLAKEDRNMILYGPLASLVQSERQALAELEQAEELQRQQLAAAAEQRRQEEIRRMNEEAEKEDAYHSMLPRNKEHSSEEQLNKMREMGISKHPFEYSTQLQRGSFPGAGLMKQEKMTPFSIAISPSGEHGIPADLLEEMHLHKSLKSDSDNPLGWIGGYADYENKILYVAEVQSDIMQRTPEMRDPEQANKQKQEEANHLKQEINALQNKINQAVSPRQTLLNKIERIKQENQTNPNKAQQNEQLLSTLSDQLNNVPDTVDTSKLENQLREKSNQFQRISITDNEEDRQTGIVDRHLNKNYSKWHKYRSKLENVFKDWIPIFFNSAFRLAKSKGYEKVRIITSDHLMQIWSSFARPETKILFERVYDKTAAFYQGQKITDTTGEWWEIVMNNPNLRIAKRSFQLANWFQRMLKQSQQNEWLVQHGGKYVWQIHLDKFFEIMKRKAPELAGDQEYQVQEGDFGANQGKRSIFEFWLEEVPPTLKMGNDLEPTFKQAVREYLIQTQGFDPYEFNEEQEIDYTPSAQELNDWLG